MNCTQNLVFQHPRAQLYLLSHTLTGFECLTNFTPFYDSTQFFHFWPPIPHQIIFKHATPHFGWAAPRPRSSCTLPFFSVLFFFFSMPNLYPPDANLPEVSVDSMPWSVPGSYKQECQSKSWTCIISSSFFLLVLIWILLLLTRNLT